MKAFNPPTPHQQVTSQILERANNLTPEECERVVTFMDAIEATRLQKQINALVDGIRNIEKLKQLYDATLTFAVESYVGCDIESITTTYALPGE